MRPHDRKVGGSYPDSDKNSARRIRLEITKGKRGIAPINSKFREGGLKLGGVNKEAFGVSHRDGRIMGGEGDLTTGGCRGRGRRKNEPSL